MIEPSVLREWRGHEAVIHWLSDQLRRAKKRRGEAERELRFLQQRGGPRSCGAVREEVTRKSADVDCIAALLKRAKRERDK